MADQPTSSSEPSMEEEGDTMAMVGDRHGGRGACIFANGGATSVRVWPATSGATLQPPAGRKKTPGVPAPNKTTKKKKTKDQAGTDQDNVEPSPPTTWYKTRAVTFFDRDTHIIHEDKKRISSLVALSKSM